MSNHRSVLTRQAEFGQGSAHHRRTRRKYPQVIEVFAILDHPARLRLAKAFSREFEGGAVRADHQQHVMFRQHHVGPGRFVVMRPAARHDLHIRGQTTHQFGHRFPREMRVVQRDLQYFHTGSRGRRNLRPQQREGDVQQQNRPRHAERIRNRIAHRRIVVTELRERRLQRCRAGSRAGEQP